MAEPLDRDTMIHLLNRLGSDSDADVLEAARYLHGRVTESGASWDSLLAANVDEPAQSAPRQAEPAAPRPPTEQPGSDDDALTLIDRLLARSDISDDLREELVGYKSDIAEGEFGASDRRYLAALHDRLG